MLSNILDGITVSFNGSVLLLLIASFIGFVFAYKTKAYLFSLIVTIPLLFPYFQNINIQGGIATLFFAFISILTLGLILSENVEGKN